MIQACKKMCLIALYNVRFLYKIARGLDYKILQTYSVKMSQEQDIDSIIHQLSRCLLEIMDYSFFAVAVYDKEYNGGIDIWMDPKTDSMAVINLIKKDFSGSNVYCNIRHFENLENQHRLLSVITTDSILTLPLLDNQTRALLYVLPRRSLLKYHHALLEIIVKSFSALLSKCITMKKLENASLIDPLTQCYNRRALNGYIDHDIANAERHRADLAIVMFDIDHFKKINDTYGHKAGDIVLRTVSRRVLSTIRKCDYLARYGGEEFILVLRDTKFSKAIELAERLRCILESLNIDIAEDTIAVTASFGVTTYKKGMGKNTLFHRADEMLYEAKRQGRNRIKPDLRLFNPYSDTSSATLKRQKSLSQ